MIRLILVSISMMLGACAWRRETIIEESVYDAVRIFDLAQTDNACERSDEGYYERRGPFLGAGWIVGKYPTRRSVTVYAVSEILLHAGITQLLEQHSSPWAVRAWEAGTIGLEIDLIAHNARIGLRASF